jgi:peptidoglycan/xylan/chitin deacetylase (PgdA/CDA1 family)
VPAAKKPPKKTPARTVVSHVSSLGPSLGPSLGKKSGGPAGSHLSTGTSAVALTFDDGPDPVQTPRMLKLLAQQHVHATFCLIGQNVRRHPELVRQIVAGGNTLCNHTWSHSLTIGQDPAAQIRADLQRTNDAIHQAAPKAKIEYFRAPGGNFTPRLVATARSLGMTSLYWKVDPRDWEHPKGESDAAHRARVITTVEKRVGKGAIILSHDYNQPDTIAAYRTLIPWLRHRYRLVALPV